MIRHTHGQPYAFVTENTINSFAAVVEYISGPPVRMSSFLDMINNPRLLFKTVFNGGAIVNN